MSSNVIKLLLGLCVFLLLILLFEYESFGLPANPSGDSRLSKQKNQSLELPTIAFSKKEEQNYPDMVDRPLFIKDRKPVAGGIEVVPIEQLGAIEDLILVGIYETKDNVVALLSQPKTGKKFIKKTEGDDIAGFLLKEIRTDRVILERGGKQQPLMLRKPRLKSKIKLKPKLNRKAPKPIKRKQIKQSPENN